MTTTALADCGCPEGRAAFSRRGFMKLLGGTTALTATTLGGARVAFAAPGEATGNVLVVLSLRGGMDGLGVVVPTGDPALADARQAIGIPRSRLTQLDSMFGLHPAMAPLVPLWRSNKLAMVHAIGMEAPNRSHFSAMDEMERAAPGSSLRTGWLDRMMGQVPASTFTVTSVGSSSLPRSMAGPNAEFGMTTLNGVTLAFGEDATPLAAWKEALEAVNADASPLVATPMTSALDAVGSLRGVPAAGAGYPDASPAPALKDLARLIKADLGVTAAAIDFGNWDMHENQGSSESGWMYDQLTKMSQALAAFAADLGTLFDKVTVVTLSEFGRRVKENGTGGTDHGYGNVSFVLGGGVKGGKVYGRWPGLAAANLVSGDLAVTTDYRQLIGEVLTKRCGVGSLGEVFPGVKAAPLGLLA